MSNYELTQQNLPSSIITGDVITCAYSGSYKTITLPRGTYKLECWGAQGGSYNSTYTGGKGGYSQGVLTLSAPTLLYLYVGQQNNSYGSSAGTSGGTAFNGGGSGMSSYYSSTYTYSCSGGGGTDIRIGSDSLYARVIVAGGGSGSTNRSNGYAGGGTTSRGFNSTYQATATTAGISGSFGVGANCVPTQTNYKYVSAGGGGGWYGGGSTTSRSDTDTSLCQQHGGGSGYVYTSSTASNYPSNCLLNSSYYLISAATTAGDSSFPSPSGGTETGHSGHGSIKITVLQVGKQITDIYLKIGENNWKKLFDLTSKKPPVIPVTINLTLTSSTVIVNDTTYTTSTSIETVNPVNIIFTLQGSQYAGQGTVTLNGTNIYTTNITSITGSETFTWTPSENYNTITINCQTTNTWTSTTKVTITTA